MPRVTAVVTTYNRRKYVGRAIASVLEQTHRDLELLVLDNSSTDGTDEVVKGFDDPRLRYVRHPPLGIAGTRNFALREARGEFVAFLDDDDEWMPRKVEAQLAAFERAAPDVALVYSGWHIVDDAGAVLSTRPARLRGRVLRDLLWQSDDFTGAASNPMLRRSAVLDVGGYDEEVLTGEDWEMYLRLAARYGLDHVDEPLLRVRRHAGPRLGDRLRDAAALDLKIMRVHAAHFDAEPRLRSRYLQKVGGKLVRCGAAAEGRRHVLRAIRASPTNVGAWAQYLLSFGGERVYRRAHEAYLANRRRRLA